MLSPLEVISGLMQLKVPQSAVLWAPPCWDPRVPLCPGLSLFCSWALFPNYWLMGWISRDSFLMCTAALVALLPSVSIKGQVPVLRGFAQAAAQRMN